MAGALAVVAGLTVMVVGATTTAAHAADAADYNCAFSGGTLGQEPVPADMNVTIAAGVAVQVQVGDPVTLSGFVTRDQVSGALLNSDAYKLVQSITGGHFAAFQVVGEPNGGQPQSVDVPMDIAQTTTTDTGFTLTAPDPPIEVSGFTADTPGTMIFTTGTTVTGDIDVLLTTGAQEQWQITCSASSVTAFASVDVSPKPTPPSTPAGSPPSSHAHPTPPGHSASVPAGLSEPSTSSTPTENPGSSPAGDASDTPTGSATTSEAAALAANDAGGSLQAAQQPHLATTGFPQAVWLTVGGGLLIVVGVGLMFAARRRQFTETS